MTPDLSAVEERNHPHATLRSPMLGLMAIIAARVGCRSFLPDPVPRSRRKPLDQLVRWL